MTHLCDKYLCNTMCQCFTKINSFSDYSSWFSKMVATILLMPVCTSFHNVIMSSFPLRGTLFLHPLKLGHFVTCSDQQNAAEGRWVTSQSRPLEIDPSLTDEETEAEIVWFVQDYAARNDKWLSTRVRLPQQAVIPSMALESITLTPMVPVFVLVTWNFGTYKI